MRTLEIPFPAGHIHSQWFAHTSDDLETLQAAYNNKKRKEMKKVEVRGRGRGFSNSRVSLYPPTYLIGCNKNHYSLVVAKLRARLVTSLES